MSEWIDRAAALEVLGVRAQTLYAYVSRGSIERREDPADPRKSLYRAADVAELKRRRTRGRRPREIAASAIAWGEPTLPTRLSTVHRGRLIYCGQDAVALADKATLESVATILWHGDAPDLAAIATDRASPLVALATLAEAARPIASLAHDQRTADAAQAVRTLAGSMGVVPGTGPIHEQLARAWGLESEGADMVRRALVLLADHELNPSTFAARVAASTGAPLAACLVAALSTLIGPRHGNAVASLASLLAEAQHSSVEAALARALDREGPLPGFGHPLYPDGDPRAAAILARVAPDPALARLRDSVERATGALPNVDFALTAITRALGLPGHAPFHLFALGRSIGWAAHAMEQVETGSLIRPRAVYVGPPPI